MAIPLNRAASYFLLADFFGGFARGDEVFLHAQDRR